MDPKTGMITATRFARWANSGYVNELEVTKAHPENRDIAKSRRKDLER
jgi:hypothetical protein